MGVRKLIVTCAASLLLVACGDKEGPVKKTTAEPQTTTEIVKEVTEEVSVAPKEKKEKSTMTYVDFDKKYDQDPDEEKYVNGVFILKSGEVVNADYIIYSNSDIFDYASAIFRKGELVALQLDTKSSIEDIEKDLGISFNAETIVDPTRSGFEIIFDKTFDDENIERFPFELD